jgi:hypothetical protein
MGYRESVASALRGLLCLTTGIEVREFWVMKEYGVANSWTLLYTVQPLGPCFSICHPSIFLSHDSEEVLISERLSVHDGEELLFSWSGFYVCTPILV